MKDLFFLFLYDHTVPLGSIQELPAKSCSEIKASEGNEMVNGDYWIYSDVNGQTILARCEGTTFDLSIKYIRINVLAPS